MYVPAHLRRGRVADEAIHTTPDGRKLLVIHGDQFDGIVRYAALARPSGRLGLRRGARASTRPQLGPPQARPALLVAVGLDLKHKVKNAVQFIDASRTRWRAKRAARRRRRGLRPHPSRRDPQHRTACSTSTTATGSRAAPPWSSTSTAGSRSSTGRRMRAPLDASEKTIVPACQDGRVNAAHRHRRLATADQWRGPHPRTHQRQLAQLRRRGDGAFPDRFRTCALPTYPEIRAALAPGRAVAARGRRGASRRHPYRHRRARSAWPCGAAASNAAAPSPPATTPASPNMCSARSAVPMRLDLRAPAPFP